MSHSVVALHVLVTHVLVLHAVVLRLSVLHDVPLTVCDVDQAPVTQRRYCDPVKHRQASQKVTDCVRHEARGASRLRGCASTPTCRSLLALPSTPPLA